VELEVGSAGSRVEIELPIEHPAADRSRIAFRPKHWKLFSAGIETPHGSAGETSPVSGAREESALAEG
jgi:sulfate transport system ATP-binding protein